ncbi:Rib/alpha-like domain-containing protein [uncultured Lactobacillus sp.]|uniref:Rib/alpha-like domain-containing protein n=1 Tax=uncultured Lactobacillus sp. TaxID=153152 RepID=UPI00262184EF|nr:Rib/alpha-like domain-containing protein [uncultured Lactobacillus sp.]
MLAKNNFKKESHTIRKISFTAAGAVIGLLFMGMNDNSQVKADTLPANNEESKQDSNQDSQNNQQTLDVKQPDQTSDSSNNADKTNLEAKDGTDQNSATSAVSADNNQPADDSDDSSSIDQSSDNTDDLVYPVAKTVEIKQNGTLPSARSVIENADQMPHNTTYQWVKTPNLAQTGAQSGQVRVTFFDDSYLDIDVPFYVGVHAQSANQLTQTSQYHSGNPSNETAADTSLVDRNDGRDQLPQTGASDNSLSFVGVAVVSAGMLIGLAGRVKRKK